MAISHHFGYFQLFFRKHTAVVARNVHFYSLFFKGYVLSSWSVFHINSFTIFRKIYINCLCLCLCKPKSAANNLQFTTFWYFCIFTENPSFFNLMTCEGNKLGMFVNSEKYNINAKYIYCNGGYLVHYSNIP